MHLFASDIEVINSIKEEYPGYNELLLLSAIILNIDGSESKILNNSIFPVGRISPCKNKRLVLKIDEIESYLDLIFSHIFIKKEECLFSIILSEEQRKDIDDIINYMKIIQNLFLNEDTENKYIKKKILNILEFYIQMLLNINYIRSLNDLKDYAKGIINIKNFILDKCLFESLKNHLNIYSFIASLRFFIEETKQSESKEKKLILKDKFYYYFYNHICLSFNNIHAPYVIKLKKNIIDTRAVPVKLNCFSESFCHDDFYTFESLEKFDNEVNKKYQKNSNMKIYFDKKSFQNIKNFNCWGLAVSVAFVANDEKSKYYDCDIYPMGCINQIDLLLGSNNMGFGCVGGIGFKLDEVLLSIVKNKGEKNIIILSYKQNFEIAKMIKLIEMIKEKLLEEKSNKQKAVLNQEIIPKYNELQESKKNMQLRLLPLLDFYILFLKQKISYIINEEEIKEYFWNSNAEKKLIQFSWRILPERIPENFLRKLYVPFASYSESEVVFSDFEGAIEKGFRKNDFDNYEELKKEIESFEPEESFFELFINFFRN